MYKSWIGLLVLVTLGVTAASRAQAQWAVVDAPAIAQLIQEVQTMAEQLQTAKDQLQQARNALQTMTGNRGMERLLTGIQRNYLPADWAGFNSLLNAGGALNNEVQGALNAGAVLTPQQLAGLSPASQELIRSFRQWNALRQAVSHAALANASGRFGSLQNLIGSIGTAGDQKAILDLQARISVELGMQQNEHTKLQVFAQSVDAQDQLLKQQLREQIIVAHGRFGTRFQPEP